MCQTPSVFVWGKLLQLLTELVFLANLLAMDLVRLWMHYSITAQSLLCYLAKYHLSSHSCSQPAHTALHSWWMCVPGCGSWDPQQGWGWVPTCLPWSSWDSHTSLGTNWQRLCTTRPSQTKHICQFSAANRYLWDILMSCFIGISTCKAPSSRI